MLVIILLKKGKKEISIVVKKYENMWVYTFSRKHSVTNPKVNSDEYDIHFFSNELNELYILPNIQISTTNASSMFDKQEKSIQIMCLFFVLVIITLNNKHTNHYKIVSTVFPTEQNNIASFSPVSLTNSSKSKNAIWAHGLPID